jgi:hypothetical protein
MSWENERHAGLDRWTASPHRRRATGSTGDLVGHGLQPAVLERLDLAFVMKTGNHPFGLVVVFVFSLAPFPAQSTPARHCQALSGTIAGASIGIPSGDVAIDAAALAMTPATRGGPEPTSGYCEVRGRIAPMDPAAPPINFQINLPLDWNGRAVQYGGGGFNGVLITGLDPLPDWPPDLPTPLARGFITYGTDSGHERSKLPETMAFALNDEALENFAHAAYKKVRDTAVKVAGAFYGRAPEKLYFYGASEGGREGLTMAQRYPADFDGIVSIVPVINWVGLQFAVTRIGIAQRDGGWLSPAKVKTVHKAVLEVCDARDGLSDGIVSNYDSCARSFDVKTLRCPHGNDSADACLSDAQIGTLETMHKRFEFPYPLANGITYYPGWNYGGEDQPGGMAVWATGPKPPQFPTLPPAEQSGGWYLGSGALRYFIARDPNRDPREITPEAYQKQAQKISALMDSTNPDLSAFERRNGKLILKENMCDFAQSPNAGVEYYKSVVASMGQDKVDRFVRFYLTPGANHAGSGVGTGGEALPHGIDLLGVLDQWVTKGSVPGNLTQTAKEPTPPFKIIASRPMCRYPTWPKYKGSGNRNDAVNFNCAID